MKIEYKERFWILSLLLAVAIITICVFPFFTINENGGKFQSKFQFIVTRLSMAYIGGYIFYLLNIFLKEVSERKDIAHFMVNRFLLQIRQTRIITNSIRTNTNSVFPQVKIDPTKNDLQESKLDKSEIEKWHSIGTVQDEFIFIEKTKNLISELTSIRHLMPRKIRIDYDKLRRSNFLKLNPKFNFRNYGTSEGLFLEYNQFISSLCNIECELHKKYNSQIKEY